MKRYLFPSMIVLFAAIACTTLVFFKTNNKNNDAIIVYKPLTTINPIIYIPNIYLLSNLKSVIRSNASRLVDTNKFYFSQLAYQSLSGNKKIYKAIFKSKLSGYTNEVLIKMELATDNQNISFSASNPNNEDIILWSSGDISNCTVGLGKGDKYSIQSPLYFLLKNEGVFLSFGNTFSQASNIISYLSKDKQYSNYGITISLPYAFVNQYFASNPLIFDNVGGGGVNIKLTSSTVKDENIELMDFTSNVKYVHLDGSFSVNIDLLTKIRKSDNQIMGFSGYSYNQSQYSSVQNLIIKDLINHLKSAVNENMLGKRIVALYQTDTLSFSAQKLRFKKEIKNNSEIEHFNDNLIFFLNI